MRLCSTLFGDAPSKAQARRLCKRNSQCLKASSKSNAPLLVNFGFGPDVSNEGKSHGS